MVKRIVPIFSIMLLVLSLSACSSLPKVIEISSESDVEIIDPRPNVKQRKLTIAVSKQTYTSKQDRYVIIDYYKEIFKKEIGIDVEFDLIDSQNHKELYKVLATRLYEGNSPDLILVEYEPYYNLIEQGIAMDVSGKIPNLDRIYSGIIDDKVYKVPIGMTYSPEALNKDVLESLGIEVPSYDWTMEDYIQIREKWIEENGPVKLTYSTLEDIYGIYGNGNVKLFDTENKRMELNTPEMKEYLRNVRKEIFSGKYIIDESYTYENFYNMLYEPDSVEYQNLVRISQNYDKNNLRLWPSATPLFAEEMNKKLIMNGVSFAYLPPYIMKESALSTWGLIININSENIELACQFVNGLLSDKAQMEMFKRGSKAYPVNKGIEEQIRAIETRLDENSNRVINEEILKFKDYVLKGIDEGKFAIDRFDSLEFELEADIRIMINKELNKIIYADEEYSDEELTQILSELENRFNILLNE